MGQGARVERMYNESWPEEGASASSDLPCPPGQPLLCPVAWPWPGPLGGAPAAELPRRLRAAAPASPGKGCWVYGAALGRLVLSGTLH